MRDSVKTRMRLDMIFLIVWCILTLVVTTIGGAAIISQLFHLSLVASAIIWLVLYISIFLCAIIYSLD